ncbi:hypothetical protein HK100_012615 [Physocladia obscura]|uniref:Uncharacterized protein n=1 Tax=Physocladia obscura TaxID=109957 RepID=A0AAD5T0Z7_9FUNG|nr:hypothetical protein HK100_012615 [Physocladia obscura]
MNVAQLAHENDTIRNSKGEPSKVSPRFTIPITLGYIALSRSVEITQDLTTRLITFLLAPEIILVPGYPPISTDLDFYHYQAKPAYYIQSFSSPLLSTYLLQLRLLYTPGDTNITAQRMGMLNFNCLTVIEELLNSLLPSPKSNIFLLDDNGLMIASTMNGTVESSIFVAPNLTFRYNSYSNNPDPHVNAVGTFLALNFGISATTNAFTIPTNFTINFMTIAETSYIVATQLVYMTGTDQVYTLVSFMPRSDFYGTSDSAFRDGLMASLLIAVGGLFLSGVLAYLGSIPLKRLAKSMEKLTKFDFSVLESGTLNSTSLVSELNNVETTFLIMVKAFARQIRKNRELKESSHKQSTTAPGLQL